MPASLSPLTPSPEAARLWLRSAFKVLRRALDDVDRAAPGADTEPVHRLRVATRRLHAVLQVCAPCLGAKARARAERQVRRLRHRAAEARDVDVMRDTLRHLAGPRPPRAWRDTLVSLDGTLVRQRQAANARLLGPVRRALARHRDRRHDLLAAVRPPQSADITDARTLLAPLVDHHLAVLAGTPLPPRPQTDALAGLHETRIAVKRLRYALELSATLADEPATSNEAALQALSALQARLGDVHDLQVLQAWLREQAIDSTALQARLERRLGQHLRGLARLWQAWLRAAPHLKA